MSGILKQIFISTENGGALLEKESVLAVSGRGLDGDRYFSQNDTDNFNAITLIEEKAAEICRARLGKTFKTSQFRRNLIVSGIDLNNLVGRKFRVGSAEMLGYELCHPCRYLSDLLYADLLDGLKNIGGIRAKILRSATIKTGDPVEIIHIESDS
ncbi:MAG: MOSC domain-containing protein [Candidatus Rifleibacteriota bacterium]